jgi:hypothetical protein
MEMTEAQFQCGLQVCWDSEVATILKFENDWRYTVSVA